MGSIKWIIPKRHRDQEITSKSDRQNSDFNAPLPENDGGVCVLEATAKSIAGQNEADTDIRAGRVKEFDNPDDMIASLKQPW